MMVVVVVVVMYLRHDLSLASFVYAVQRSKVDRGTANLQSLVSKLLIDSSYKQGSRSRLNCVVCRVQRPKQTATAPQTE